MKILEKIKDGLTYGNIGILVVGVLLGWLIFGGGRKSSEIQPAEHTVQDHPVGSVWTCAMHPQIREDEPGNCPICGMELVPLESDDVSSGEEGEFTVRLSDAAMKIAEVEMRTIQKMVPYKEIYLPGKVIPDERNIAKLTSRFPGRIEKLSINFTGQKVRKGQALAKIYSPELVTAQRELFEAIKLKETNPKFYEASRNKLKLWDLTEEQISAVEKSGDVKFYFDVLSPMSGTVTMRHVAVGDYVKEGDPLFEVTDLRRVWVMFDAYESDIPWIKLGDRIKFKIKSMPGKEFESTVTFIDPVLDRMSRVAGVRTELNNPADLLKPQMLASGILKTMLPGSEDKIVVPKSAVLWTGKKAVVYVLTSDHSNMFLYREIVLGAEAGDYYVVEEGLMEGERVASNGVFKIDAAAQLKGEKSMMNPEGGKQSLGGHAGMDMGEDTSMDMELKGEKEDEQPGNMEMDRSVDEQFQEQLTEVYRSQFELQEAFLATDAVKAKEAVPFITAAINTVDMSLVMGDMHNYWMDRLKELNNALSRINDSDDIDLQRLAYADFNDALYAAIKKFGTVGETIYYQFCPMARGGDGAYWLSESEEIENPYYGEAMLTCGETKEIIN